MQASVGIIRVALLALLALFCAMQLSASAAERAPFRIAKMPTRVTAVYGPDDKVLARLDARVEDAVHVPLGETLGAVQFFAEAQMAPAYEAAREAAGKKADYPGIVRAMGEKLGADLVVLPLVTRYEQFERLSRHWDRGMIRTSYAAVELYVYDRKSGRVIDKAASRYYADEMSVRGEVSVMVEECMDQALREAGLHDLVMEEALPKQAEGAEVEASEGKGATK